jgi:PQQ-dependent catabolism-associated CXXCW motif protein
MRWCAIFLALWTLACAANELRDYGVAPSAQLRLDDHASPTPLEIPGARLIATAELRAALEAPLEQRPLLFDVLGGDGHLTLPGAIWLPGAGRGSSFDDEVQARLAKLLELATRGNRNRELVFFCASPSCWLSYNTALRAARLGYGGVRWYRGGIEAWRAAGGPVSAPRVVWKMGTDPISGSRK